MTTMTTKKGGFTLPGESGYEDLTLELAEKWGADVIRDSDGTDLSDKLLNSGYDIYSTICIIRDHNEWANENLDKLQQSFLMTPAKVAESDKLTFRLLDGFFEEQFRVNTTKNSMRYWQVFDRTSNTEHLTWDYDETSGVLTVADCKPWHKYTVNFLAYRIWEEISMYNHVTNDWGDKEHLMPIEPMYPETQKYMLDWLENWCKAHPHTDVVRFTSMFYNFVWIWGDDKRSLYVDWGSYDFSVSDIALDKFAEKYGYSLTSEDFINKGKLNVSHIPFDKKKRDWMEFIGDFSLEFGKKLIDIVHSYGKKAYVFYDDSWVGLEPYHERFGSYGFDGMIKCVFSGYEVRLCADVDAPVHEIRLHPYLFPVGLGGAPTFMEGGNPTADAQKYWVSVRRALLRKCVDRIGLGGYLSLTLPFPEFNDYIEQIAKEFRAIRYLHENGTPLSLKPKVAILTAWGKLRSWTLSGHFHETYMHELIHVIESLSGLPLEVSFISFDDIPQDVDVIINAGSKGSAWSGGDHWKDDVVVEKLTEWVHKGGIFIGIGEPSAVDGYDNQFRMAHVLGVDMDNGEYVCHGKLPLDSECGVFLTNKQTKVLSGSSGAQLVTKHEFGKGAGVYLSSYSHSYENARVLLGLIAEEEKYISSNVNVDCAYFPGQGKLALVNNTGETQKTTVNTPGGSLEFSLLPYELSII